MNDVRMNEQMSKRYIDKSYVTGGDIDMTHAASGSGEEGTAGEV